MCACCVCVCVCVNVLMRVSLSIQCVFVVCARAPVSTCVVVGNASVCVLVFVSYNFCHAIHCAYVTFISGA